MTDRIRSLTIILEEDMRVDDAEAVIQAVRMVKGVSRVEEGPVLDMRDYLAREAAARVIFDKLHDALHLFVKGGK